MRLKKYHSAKQFKLKIVGAFLVCLCCLNLIFYALFVSANFISDAAAKVGETTQPGLRAVENIVSGCSAFASKLDAEGRVFGRSIGEGGQAAVFEVLPEMGRGLAGILAEAGNAPANTANAGKASIFSFANGLARTVRDIVRGWLGIVDPAAVVKTPTVSQSAPSKAAPEAVGAGSPKTENSQPADTGSTGAKTNNGNVTVVNNNNNTYYQPVKEVLSTNTLVQVDQETKDRVNLILKQLNPDRPNFSLGQTFNLPENLKGNTININSGHFTVDKYGNIVTLGDVEITGNFTVTGAQTFSGAAVLNASTTTPLFAIDQAGAGAALRADNIALKGSTISTVGSDTSLLIDPNGTGTVQFHSAQNSLDPAGNLALAGNVTAGTFNGLTQTSRPVGFTISGGTANAALTVDADITASQLATLDGAQTLTNKTLTGPVIRGAITGTDALSLAAGGADQNITLTPSGAGYTILNGNVGIGTTSPGAKLAINGDLLFSNGTTRTITGPLNESLVINGRGNSAYEGVKLQYGGVDGLILNNAGNVGIGTATPAAKLQVYGTDLDFEALRLAGNSSSANSIVRLNFYDRAGATDNVGSIYTKRENSGANWGLHFATELGSSPASDKMVIDSAGNVGIGTTASAAKLEIDGSADSTQLIVKANSTQSNTNPLIKLQNSAGTDLAWLSSDNANNIFLGYEAGRSNTVTTGSYGLNNTFIGSGAGRTNTTGFANTATGLRSLYANTTGNYNVANGVAALWSNTTGYQNTASGYASLYFNTTGYNNTANGEYALYSNTTGINNAAVGMQALYNNTASYNTAVGVISLYSNTTGASNAAQGYQALYANTTGSYNTANGSSALYSNITGNYNAANGYYSLFSNTTGARNTGLGYYADYLVPSGTGTLNLSNGSANLGVGLYRYKITYVLTINATSYETSPSIYSPATTTAGNQEVTITAIPTYSGPYTCTARKIYRTAVGITTSYKLAGTIGDNLTTFFVDSLADGSLGAEAASPSNSIMLGAETKAIKASQFAIGSDNAPITEMWLGRGVYSAALNNVQLSASGRNGLDFAGSDLALAGGFGTGTGLGGNLIFKTAPAGAVSSTLANSLVEAMRITGAGNVGIGTAAPASQLDVRSVTGGILTLSRNDTSVTAGDTLGVMQFWSNDTQTTTNNIAASISAIAKSTIATNINPGILAFSTTPSTVAGVLTERMRIDETGNVGIGTTGPGAKLDVTQANGKFSLIVGADVNSDSRTDSTRKFSRMACLIIAIQKSR